MAVSSSKDVFPQLAYLYCIESAANTLTWAKLEVATGAMLGKEKFGMVIHQILYEVAGASFGYFNATGDSLGMCLSVSSNLTSIDLAAPEVIDKFKITRLDIGAAASGMFIEQPEIHDFSGLGGLLVPADRLYLGIQGNSLTTAAEVKVRLWYTMKQLSVDEYWDLVESRRIIST